MGPSSRLILAEVPEDDEVPFMISIISRYFSQSSASIALAASLPDGLTKVTQNSTCRCAWTWLSRATKWAARSAAARIFQLKRSAVEASPKNDLPRWDIIAPEELDSKLDLGKISMALNYTPNGIIAVPKA